jgi:hypothetical protein
MSINRIDGVMVSVLASRAVYGGFNFRSGPIKDYEIGICGFSAKHTALQEKEQRLVDSEDGQCVRAEQHICTRTVVSGS